MTMLGKKHSKETIEKISKANKGKLLGRIPWNKGLKTGKNLKHSIRMSGINHPKWKGLRKKSNNYILIYCPSHPKAVDCRVAEHRLVIENHLGRFLKSEELVHHINGNGFDNRIENLQLCSKNEHSKIHAEINNLNLMRGKTGGWEKCVMPLQEIKA